MFGAKVVLTLLSVMLATDLIAASTWVKLPGTPAFRSALAYEDSKDTIAISPFALMTQPVTNAQFLSFLKQQEKWRRGIVPIVFAESRYLEQWSGPLSLGAQALPEQPVTRVSWFAAQAYCAAAGARLPSWLEWEYAAAADATRTDARGDPAWRERILSWYAKPSNVPLSAVAQSSANIYGVYDLHGLVWEWVEDYAAMLVSPDNRDQGDADRLKFCGAGALSTNDRENYAVLMRIAMLSALEADDTTGNLGFRCARDLSGPTP